MMIDFAANFGINNFYVYLRSVNLCRVILFRLIKCLLFAVEMDTWRTHVAKQEMIYSLECT